MEMKEVKLDIFELGYLFDACLRGSHLRSVTLGRFEWYYKSTWQKKFRYFTFM